jgi:hypothetical protein
MDMPDTPALLPSRFPAALLLVMGATIVLCSSCGDDEPEGPANNPPRLSILAEHDMTAGELRSIEFFATDADGDAMTFATVANPGFISLENFSQVGDTAKATCIIAPTEAHVGTFSGTLRVTDDKGGEDNTDFSIRVEPFAPQPGEWWGRTEFGQLHFTVNDQSSELTEVTFVFDAFQCGGATGAAKIPANASAGWPITDREFTIQASLPGLSMTINGTFISNHAASGTWSGLSFGNTCGGDWRASRIGYNPVIALMMNASFNMTRDAMGFWWLPGSHVTLELDNGADGTIDYERTSFIDNTGEARFQNYMGGTPFSVAEGDTIRMYDAITEIIWAAEYLKVKTVDTENDVVTGSARPGKPISVGIFDPPGFPDGLELEIWPDAVGSWTADFAGVFDLTPSTRGFAATRNPNVFAYTQIDWGPPN